MAQTMMIDPGPQALPLHADGRGPAVKPGSIRGGNVPRRSQQPGEDFARQLQDRLALHDEEPASPMPQAQHPSHRHQAGPVTTRRGGPRPAAQDRTDETGPDAAVMAMGAATTHGHSPEAIDEAEHGSDPAEAGRPVTSASTAAETAVESMTLAAAGSPGVGHLAPDTTVSASQAEVSVAGGSVPSQPVDGVGEKPDAAAEAGNAVAESSRRGVPSGRGAGAAPYGPVQREPGSGELQAPPVHSQAYQAVVGGLRTGPAPVSHVARAVSAAVAAAQEQEATATESTTVPELQVGDDSRGTAAHQGARIGPQDRPVNMPEVAPPASRYGRGQSGHADASGQTGITPPGSPRVGDAPAAQAPEAMPHPDGTPAGQAVEQVMARARALHNQGVRTVEVQLRPESLGRVFLRVSEDASGTMEATIRAERPEVALAMRERLDELTRSLGQQGLKLGQISVASSRESSSVAGDLTGDGHGTSLGTGYSGWTAGHRYGSGSGHAGRPEGDGKRSDRRETSVGRTQPSAAHLGAIPSGHRLYLVA